MKRIKVKNKTVFLAIKVNFIFEKNCRLRIVVDSETGRRQREQEDVGRVGETNLAGCPCGCCLVLISQTYIFGMR